MEGKENIELQKRQKMLFEDLRHRLREFKVTPENNVRVMRFIADEIGRDHSVSPPYAHNIAGEIDSQTKSRNELFLRAIQIRKIYESNGRDNVFLQEMFSKETAELIKDLMETIWDSEGNLRSKDAKHAADIRHSKPGGSRDKKEKIRATWASGKFADRNTCAEEEYAGLGFGAYKTARDALKNTPDPSPWPAKKKMQK